MLFSKKEAPTTPARRSFTEIANALEAVLGIQAADAERIQKRCKALAEQEALLAKMRGETEQARASERACSAALGERDVPLPASIDEARVNVQAERVAVAKRLLEEDTRSCTAAHEEAEQLRKDLREAAARDITEAIASAIAGLEPLISRAQALCGVQANWVTVLDGPHPNTATVTLHRAEYTPMHTPSALIEHGGKSTGARARACKRRPSRKSRPMRRATVRCSRAGISVSRAREKTRAACFGSADPRRRLIGPCAFETRRHKL